MNDEKLRLNLKNAGKYQLGYLQKSSINWTEFLRSSSNHYSRDFIEQLLITAQYPNATAVMEKELWKSNHYKVNYGENGITVFKDFNGEFSNEKEVQAAEIKIYYDISQVHQIAGTTITRWSLGDVDESIVLNALQKSYSKADTKSFTVAVLTSLGTTVIEVNSDIRNFIINSAAYQILTRCGYDAKSLFKLNDFKYVETIKDIKEFIRIATTVSKTSGDVLKLIAKTVRNNYNKNTVSVKKEAKENGINIQSERRYEQGRTNDNIRRVSNRRRWSENSSNRSQQRGTNDTREIRNNAPELAPKGTGGSLHGTNVTRQYNGVSAQHTGISRTEKRNSNKTNDEIPRSDRGTKSQRPNEMGGFDEQHQTFGRGNSYERDSLHLNDKFNIAENKAGVDVTNQTSAFSIPKEININSFIQYAHDIITNNVKVINTHENSDNQNYNLEVKDALRNIISDLKMNKIIINGYEQADIVSFINRYDNDIKMQTYIFNTVSKNVDISLKDLEVAKSVAKEMGLPFINRFSKGIDDDFDPYEYDGSMSVEDFDEMHRLMELDEITSKNAETIKKITVGDEIVIGDTSYKISSITNDFMMSMESTDGTGNSRQFIGDWKQALSDEANGKLISIKTEKAFATQNAENIDLDKGKAKIHDDNTEQYPLFQDVPLNEVVEQNIDQTLAHTKPENFHIINDNLGIGTKSERFKNNISAIRLLKEIEDKNRFATKEEQDILSKYVGWGGLSNYFEKSNGYYNELRSYLSDEEFRTASESTLTAFYTPPIVIKSIYNVLENLGFEKGNILEPSCGIGNFMGMLPESMQESKMFGVELDNISGRIAKQLYQNNNISIGGYENENLPDSFFDVAVGNVPFGQFQVSDKRYNKHKFLIHDYFFAKTLDKVRPGGVIAFITSKGTLDKKNNRVRKYIAERATLLGAIRLPNDTFKGAAGTEVTSDIIFLQKKETLFLDNPDWLYLKKNEDGITVNQYFTDNPDMVLGNMKLVSGQYGQETVCLPDGNSTLEEKLNSAIAKIQGQITDYNYIVDIDETIEQNNIHTIPADPTVRNYSYAIVDDDIYFRKDSIMEKKDIKGLPAERIRGLIKIRKILTDLIDYQTNDYPEDYIVSKCKELNDIYEQFTSKYGLINSKSNRLVFNEDSSFPLLISLEVIDEDGNLKRKSDIFFKRTINPYIPITHSETSVEALAVSMNERGKVDIQFMSKLTGFSSNKVISDLKDIVYPVPGKDEYQTADEYLSGNVREKLFVAQNAAIADKKYINNVKALEKIQPVDLSAAEVNVRLGATWIDAKYIKDFIKDIFKPNFYISDDIGVKYSEYTGRWSISNKRLDTGVLAQNTYGTDDYNAYYLLELALNLKIVNVYDTRVEADGKKVKIFNSEKTTLARKKQEKIKQKFEEWIFSEPQRRNDLLRTYNDTFNCIRNREFDGSHLTFPGMNPEIALRPHQINAIARTLYGGNTLLAHVVGAGKTFEMVASAMEAKRIGLCNKSLFVVPNHLTEQMGADFLRLYPAANILVATKNDFTAKKRKEFCSRIATGDYDAVIIGHSQFEKIPISIQRQHSFIENEIDEILKAIDEVKSQNGENFTIKQLEGERKKLEKKLDDLYKNKQKDNVVTFEQLGVDRLFVDEAHKFKNLFIRTKMTRVAGISSSSSDKSADLLMKCRYIDEITDGKGIVFATGTPVSNSMSELYTMQRYLQFDTLKKLGFANFDSWASTFGATVTANELAPEGKKYREKTRFSKFYNLPELMSIFKECADIQTADMLKLPVPSAKFETIVAKPSNEQKALVDECGHRADLVRSGSVDPREDNMLKITTDGRKLAVDQRIIDPELPDFAGSKINMCINNVFHIWQDTSDNKSTQLVFCDLSTPSSEVFNVYSDIRKKLIGLGIPEEEIAFIHDYNTDTQKANLFSAVRQGKIRVLLGSTEKMGAGTNVQDKLIALHDLDCPWRPSDLQQRLGRIVRQGNENDEVFIYRYITEDTFDAYSYQIIENKQKFISQIMSSKTPVREAEDVDQSALSYAEIKMLATGNPLIKEKMDLDIKFTNLKVLKSDYLSNKYRLEDMILKAPKTIALKEQNIHKYDIDISTAQNHQFEDGKFKIELNGTTYIDKKNAGLCFIKILEKLPHQVKTDNFVVGEYRGFSLSVGRNDNLPFAYLQGELNYQTSLSDDIYGNLTRINNLVNSIPKKREEIINSLEDYKEQVEQMKIESKKPFEQEKELTQVTDRLEEVNRMLTTSDKDVEYKGVSEIDVQALENAGIEFDAVVDKSGKNDYIIKYEKANKQQVKEIIANPLSSLLRR